MDPMLTETVTAEATADGTKNKAADRRQKGGEKDNVWRSS